jgi:transitional endoplasmic reticulum ATPase
MPRYRVGPFHIQKREPGSPIAKRWVLRALVRDDAFREISRDTPHFEADVAALVGLPPHLQMEQPGARHRTWLAKELKRVARAPLDDEDVLARNARLFGRAVGLSEVERQVLIFAILRTTVRGIEECFSMKVGNRQLQFMRRLAHVIELPEALVRKALQPLGLLRGGGLVCFDATEACPLKLKKMELLGTLVEPLATRSRLLADFVREAPKAKLAISDYDHIQEDVVLAVRLLRGAILKGARGVHVLLHGPSGTGKTELARVLASASAARLYEVPDADSDGEAMTGPARLEALFVAQRFLGAARRPLLILDEMEDAFPERSSTVRATTTTTSSKSWVHTLLEGSRVPVPWTTNNIGHLDRATLRRFDLVIEVPVPPRTTRRRILGEALGKTAVHGAWIDRLAETEGLAPAQASRLARIARIARLTEPVHTMRVLDRVVAATIKNDGARPKTHRAEVWSGAPNLAFVNADVPLDELANQLRNANRATVLLHGPPGTGKTTFVELLAKRFERPLHLKQASDLLSKYVGETEHRLSCAFQEAAKDRAILFFDEVDSFLRSRELAQRGWEITEVNELLQQMERFEGVFVCATNLLDGIDRAALRRFDVKVRFDVLTDRQRVQVFGEYFPGAGDEPDWRETVFRFEGLTLGDFAAVRRRADLGGGPLSSAEIIARLRAEVDLRCGQGQGRRRIGFLPSIAQ